MMTMMTKAIINRTADKAGINNFVKDWRLLTLKIAWRD